MQHGSSNSITAVVIVGMNHKQVVLLKSIAPKKIAKYDLDYKEMALCSEPQVLHI